MQRKLNAIKLGVFMLRAEKLTGEVGRVPALAMKSREHR